MATSFDKVYASFLMKISDFDWVDLVDDDLKLLLKGLLDGAIARFETDCVQNLIELYPNEETGDFDSFASDLTDIEVDILSEIMIENWLKPKLYNLDLLRNRLSTKDFTTFSPANLLNAIRETFQLSHERSESLINKYTFVNNDVRNLPYGDS